MCARPLKASPPIYRKTGATDKWKSSRSIIIGALGVSGSGADGSLDGSYVLGRSRSLLGTEKFALRRPVVIDELQLELFSEDGYELIFILRNENKKNIGSCIIEKPKYHTTISGLVLYSYRDIRTYYLKNFSVENKRQRHGTFMLLQVVRIFKERPITLKCISQLIPFYEQAKFKVRKRDQDLVEMILE